ncbi:hypothetical protein HY491_01105, partial [Candidatus Woesearchaeota archaeon]|nr:hypothetical protein [Candidatus Woesearchaeota archaeon]
VNASMQNIGFVNITLPTGMTYGTDSNKTFIPEIGSALTTPIILDSAIGVQFKTSGQTLEWNVTALSFTNISVTNVTFSFNVTVLPSFSTGCSGQCFVNFTVGANNSDGKVHEYVIYEKVFIDGKLPTLSSAKTNSTVGLNVTFSEKVNGSTVKTNSFNITFANRSDLTQLLPIAVSGADNLKGGNDTQLTVTIASIAANETPKVHYNGSTTGENASAITDLAGNAMDANMTATNTVTSTDGAPPTFKSGTLNLNVTGSFNVNLTLDFDEPMAAIPGPVIADEILILISNRSASNVTVRNPLVITTVGSNGTTLYITLNSTDAANLSRFRTSVNVTIHPRFFNDSAGNVQTARVDALPLTFTNDTVAPTLVNYTYFTTSQLANDTTNGTSILQLGFNEPVDLPSIVPAEIKIAYNQNHRDSKLLAGTNLSDASFENSYVQTIALKNDFGGFHKTLNLTLDGNYTNLIAAWDRKGLATLYISISNSTIYDLSANVFTGVLNSSGQAISWTQDTTVPRILTASISDVNVTGPGSHRITIQFSENMTNSTSTVQYVSKGSSSKTLFNITLVEGTAIWTGYYNFTTDLGEDGEWNISVSGPKDLSGNLLTNGSTDLKFTLDTTPPFIVYAYYLENGTNGTGDTTPYNGTLNDGDTLVLVFNEPLQSVETANISTTFNLTFRDGVLGHPTTVNNTRIEGKKVVITAGAATLSLRGEWVDVVNASALQAFNTRVSTNGSAWLIRDKADNFATNKSATTRTTTSVTGPKTVIADYAFTAPNNTAVTVSFPTCVNTGNMSAFLPSSTSAYSFVSYYNTNSWTDTAIASLRQLVGYRFTWSDTGRNPSQDGSDDVFRVYLKNQSDCSVESTSITIGNGWNYLATDGNYYSSSKNTQGRLQEIPRTWLNSLSAAGTVEVSKIQYGFGNTTTYASGGFVNWDTLSVGPFTALWVDSSNPVDRSFTGAGRT